MDTADYNQKMIGCLNSPGANIDPTFSFNAYSRRVRKRINGDKYLIDKDPLKQALLKPNPCAPVSLDYQSFTKKGLLAPNGFLHLGQISYRLLASTPSFQ